MHHTRFIFGKSLDTETERKKFRRKMDGEKSVSHILNLIAGNVNGGGESLNLI